MILFPCALISLLAVSSAPGKAEAVFHSCLNRHLESTGSLPVSFDEYELGLADLNRDGLLDGIALMGAGTQWVGSGGAALFVFTGEGKELWLPVHEHACRGAGASSRQWRRVA
jgi:hypothetical protein